MIAGTREFKGNTCLQRGLKKKIQGKVEGSRSWVVAGIAQDSFDVDDGGKRGLVDFSNGTCSCWVWQVSGLPCGHVIVVSRFLGEPDCAYYAMSCYTNEVYKSTYEEHINPAHDKSEWEIPDGLVNLQPPPLITKRLAGRPKENKRILLLGEDPTPIYCEKSLL
ncbi:uncharacterized protein LOC110932128 [Helianthus annuus]|uniref:uncharacterized protein LOC110932128 n=1 Tax=Helianthus annuus TaxID=4232 RepID=UPI000B90261B|nr:uncharacterized protein LOC110932128 [Helianthus annuus]